MQIHRRHQEHSPFCKILVFILIFVFCFFFFVKNKIRTNKMKDIICAVNERDLAGNKFPSNYKKCPVSMYLCFVFFLVLNQFFL